jgi:CHAT domain-containing protein
LDGREDLVGGLDSDEGLRLRVRCGDVLPDRALQRAFLTRDARSVLMSLWSVSDEATELLMRRFYAHWLRDADRPAKAEALRRAQGDVRATRGYAEARYWAGFQLVGGR